MQFDFDTIDEWAPHITKVLGPLLPADIAERVRQEKPKYVEDARDIVIQHGDIGKIGMAIIGWLKSSNVLAYHGTRLTSEEVASVERGGFLPLKVSSRKSRLERALASHPQWPEAATRLDEVFSKFASGYAGAREGQVHFTLSRAGLGGFDHYMTHGAEVDHHIAQELIGNGGYELLAADGTPMVYKIAIPGEMAVKATHPYFTPEEMLERGELPNMAGDIINAWSYRLYKPIFQSSSLEIDCGLVFNETVPAAWIVGKEVVELGT